MRINRTRRSLKAKIKNLAGLTKIIAKLRRQGKKVVFTNGCFDLLHYGHAKYLQDAKGKGDILVVAINSDISVKKIKGKRRPIVNEKDRLSLIAALESVDYVVLFSQESPLRLIKTLKPDVLVKGADWNKSDIVGSDFILNHGGSVSTVRKIRGRSTTNLIRKIAKTF